MKIAIFSDNFYPELSGISDSILLLAKELAKLGHEIKFFVPKYSARNYKFLNLANQELDYGKKIKFYRLSSLPAPFAGKQARMVLPLFLRRLFKDFKPDIIHTQLFFGAGVEALVKSKTSRLPIIGTNHTAISEFVNRLRVNSKFIKRISLNYAAWYYNCCDFVTAPSQSVFKEMREFGFNKPSRVISNPIDLNIFRALSDKLEFKRKFKLSENTIVYAGRLAPEKNIDVLIKAAAIVKKSTSNFNLAIAGSGHFESELKRLVKDLGIVNEVKFFGTLSHVDLAKLYQGAEVFAIASTSETQSLVLMQALACGLPAVVVDSRALPEYVNKKNGFVVRAGDEKAMAEKFVWLLRNQKLRQELGRSAAESIHQFSAPNIAQEWEKLYLKVIRDYELR